MKIHINDCDVTHYSSKEDEYLDRNLFGNDYDSY